MFTGKRFRLNSETSAIEQVGGKYVAIEVPENSVVLVISGPTHKDSRMVDVEWDSRRIAMFTEDIQRRGEEVDSGASQNPGTSPARSHT